TTPHPETVAVQPVPDTFFIPREPCPTPNDPSDTNRTDVLFLLDSSNSFNEHKFMHAIQLILDTVSQFRNIGPNGTQVSLVQYNSEPYLEFSLRKHNCKQWLIDDIADTDYMQVQYFIYLKSQHSVTIRTPQPGHRATEIGLPLRMPW
ncbi:von Willebrand factor type A domain protein, partial [Trichostrongylus colubriformis]